MRKHVFILLITIVLASLLGCNVNINVNDTAFPQTTDYSDKNNWAYYGIGEDKGADLFLICPTVDMNDEYNMSMDDEKTKEHFVGALNMERGIYEDSTRMYAPYYRQAAMKVYGIDKQEWEQYMQIAYSDISAAFDYYLENENDGRPIVLAGFSQGADMCYRLLEEYFGDEELYDRLVAVYAIGWPCTVDMVEKYPQIKPAQSADDLGTVISIDCEAEDVTGTFVYPEDVRAYTINPLNWSTDPAPADKSLNEGACFTNYDGEIVSEIKGLCGCHVDEKRGVIKITDIFPEDYPARLSLLSDGAYHIYDYQFFYRNLQENVANRVNIYNAGDELLSAVVERAKDIRSKQMGYPGNEDVRLRGFYEWYLKNDMDKALLNNAGDPNDYSSDHGTLEVEHEVIEFFAPFYGFEPDEVWGLVTASGTDGNDHGIYFGRNYLQSETGADPILYVSTESHYSNMRLAELQQIETRLIPTDDMGRMIPEEFRKALDPKRPALVVFSMGTTFKGGIDDQKVINEIIDEIDPPAVYRHVDAALFGGYLPFSDYSDFVDRRVCGFDSIAVSGHKFFGMDEPCGLFFTTKGIMAKQNPYDISYLNESMPMINCSRSALNPLKFYWIIKNTGEEGFRTQVGEMLDNAAYLKQRLDEIGWPAWISCEQSNTVFFKRPSESIMEKYYLAPDNDERFGGDLAHVVVMQTVSKEVIDRLIEDLLEEMNPSSDELTPAA